MPVAENAPCPECNGGGHNLHGVGLCLYCDGRGLLKYAKPVGQCPACNGTGSDENSVSGVCATCSGTGKVRLPVGGSVGVKRDSPQQPAMRPSSQEKIVAAALLINGVTFSIPQPARHHTIMHSIDGLVDQEKVARGQQGFLTSHGRFVNRVFARDIAYRAGQDPKQTGGRNNPELFSEDLW